MRPAAEPVNVLDTRGEDFHQPSPWLEFLELETAISGTLRYVDFADPDAGGAAGDEVPFDSKVWNYRAIERSALESSADAMPRCAIAIADPDHTLTAIIRAERAASRWGLLGRMATLYRCPYDQLATPSMAERYRMRILSARPTRGQVAIEIGYPNLRDIPFPRDHWTRSKCPHRYDRRFRIGNKCRYPSDDFEIGTAQIFGGDFIGYVLAAATERDFGWWTVNADRCAYWHTGQEREVAPFYDPLEGEILGVQRSYMTCYASGSNIRWLDGERHGPYQYKLIDGDFDVAIELRSGVGPAGGGYAGLLVQDAGSLGDWLAHGVATNPASGDWTVRRRLTLSGSSTDDDGFGNSGAQTVQFLRMVRVGDDLKTYTWISAPPSSGWEDETTSTIPGLGSTVRLGIFASHDDAGDQDATITVRRFAFASGGLTSCALTPQDCEAHHNTHQFGALSTLQGTV